MACSCGSCAGFKDASRRTTWFAACCLMPRDPARVDINPHFTLAFSRSLNMFTRFCRSEDGVLLSSLFSGRTQLHGDWSHLQGIPSRVGGRGEAPLEPPAAHSSLTMIIKISSCDAHSDESKHPTHLHLRILRRASSTADRRSTRTGRSRIPRPPPAPAVPTARFRARRPSPPEPFPRRSS